MVPETKLTPDRRALCVSRFVLGETLEAIGRDYGVSRERVRQVIRADGCDLQRHGGTPSVDVGKLMAAVRDPQVTTIVAVARRVGAGSLAVTRAMEALGLTAAVRRLFRWRVDWQVLGAVRQVAAELGRMPTSAETREIPGCPTQAGLQHRFGGLQAVARRLGLAPNRPGHWVHGTPATHVSRRRHAGDIAAD